MTIGVGTFNVTEKMRALVGEVLDTGRITYGPMSQEFERRFAKMHQAYFAVLSNSGTSSLQVALQTLKEIHHWRDGDEVIVPALTFVATVNVVLHNDLKPVLIDVDPETYTLDPRWLKAALTERTRAILPVHVFGQPCEMDKIAVFAHEHRLKIIEDSCECMGIKHHGLNVGAWGDVGCFSTYAAHLLTTGVGGIAVTHDAEYARVMRSLVNHGRDGIYISIDDDEQPTREIIEKRFRFERVGHSFRITELEAALGLGQLDDLPDILRQRQQNAETLTRGLAPYADELQLPRVRDGGEHAWMMYPLVLRREPKGELCAWLEENGIETREMLPLTNQPCYRGMFRESDYPVAAWINRSGFYVGCHQALSADDLTHIVEMVGAYFEKNRAASPEFVYEN